MQAAGSPNSLPVKSKTTSTTKAAGTTPATTTTKTTTNVNQNAKNGVSANTCTQDGFIGDSKNCNKFYQCIKKADGTYGAYAFNCVAGLVFDPKSNACNWKTLVPDCSS